MNCFELLFVFVAVVVTVLYLVFAHFYSFWEKRGVPHEKPTSLIRGNAKELSKTVSLTDIIGKLYNKFKESGPFFGIYLSVRPVAVVTDLDLIKNILIKDFNYFTDRGVYYNERDDPLSAHLFALDGAEWRFMRTKLTPTFTSGKMKFMFPTILKVGHEFERVLTKAVEDQPELEIKEFLARFTTDVIGTCAFGIDCNSLKDPNAEFRRRGRDLFENPSVGPMRRSFLQAFPNFAKFFRMKVTRDDLTKFFIDVVQETVNYREKNGVRRNDFMDLLIEVKNSEGEGNGLTLNQMAAQAFVFFIAGFETSSTTMGYTLYELARNHVIQDKLRAEINEVLKRHNGELTYDAMMEMKYLEQVMNETLRMYPPVPVLFRTAIKDYKVPDSNLVLEKGRGIFIPNYAIQHDPEVFPKPEVFDPDRFTPEEVHKRHTCATLPFGDGPRNCIGLRFGKMQTRIGLVLLLKNFKFSHCKSTQNPITFDKNNLILCPEKGITLRVDKL